MNKYLCLTFDDGPSFDSTMDDMLDVLEKHKVKASFFVVGNKINDQTQKTLQRAVKLGCELYNHSWSHSHMGQDFSKHQIEKEIEDTDNAIKKITGKIPEFFRPPYLDVSPLLFDTVNKPFIAGCGCEDWLDEHSAEYRVETSISQAKDGAIYLLHVMEKNYRTVQAIDKFIPLMQAQYYSFVTVEELFKIKNINPTEWQYKNKMWNTVK